MNQAAGTRNGFAYQVPGLARERGYASSSSTSAAGARRPSRCSSDTTRCGGPAPGGRDYARPDADRRRRAVPARATAAGRPHHGLDRRQRRDRVRARGRPDPVRRRPRSRRSSENVTETAERLRKAAGRKVRIVGTTYPNVLLGQWVGAEPEPGPRAALERRVQGPHQPGAEARRTRRPAAGFVDVTAATRRVRLARGDDVPAGRLRHDPAARRQGLRVHLLLRVPRHPRAHERLQADRGADRQDAAAPMTAERLRAAGGAQGLPLHDPAARAGADRAARGRDRRDRRVPVGHPPPARRAGRARAAVRRGVRRHGHRHADAAGRGRGARARVGGVRADPDGPGARHAADRALRLRRAQAALPAALRDAASGRRRSACPSPTPARTRPRCARARCSTATSG